MNPQDMDELLRTGAERLEEMLRRPPECRAWEMELKTALGLPDVARCQVLLQEKGPWLAQFKSHGFAELMSAAILADAAADELVDLLLQSGVPAHSVHDQIGPAYQQTPLVTAARIGRLDLIQKLVGAGADLFWTSPTGTNALSEILPSRACQDALRDTPEMARVREWLMEQGVRIDPLCADSRRKLLWASRDPGSWPDIPALLRMGIPPGETGWTPFMQDLAFGTVDVLRVNGLVEAELQHRDAWNRTPFLLAVTAGNLEMARALVDRGSDLLAIGHHGATALSLAAEYNHVHVIGWLLENGFTVEDWNSLGYSALRAAVGNNALEAARLLLQKGAKRDERDSLGDGLIHSVDLRGDLAMLQLLMKAGAAINDVSGDGSWPLSSACQQGNAAAVEFLLRAGADPNLTSTGETALFAAVSANSLECVRLLVQAGADVNAVDCDGWTCLFHLRSESVANCLLEQGADPGIADQCGGLPEDWGTVPIAIRQKLRDWRTGRQHRADASSSREPQ